MAAFSLPRLSILLLVAFSSLLPLLSAQRGEPDAMFHGWAMTSFALDPNGPYVLVNDAHTFLHGVDLAHSSRQENIYIDPSARIQKVAINRRGRPIIATDSHLTFFDDQWRPRFNVSVRSLDSRVGYWFSGDMLVDSYDYIYILGSNTTTYFVTVLDGDGVKRDSWILPGRVTSPTWCMDASNNIYVQERVGPTRGLRVFSSGGVLTDTLTTNLTGFDSIDAIAVSRNGNIFLTARGLGASTLLAFNAAFRPIGRYSLALVAESITQITFDVYDNLWVLDSRGETILAFDRVGDLMFTVSSDVPNLQPCGHQGQTRDTGCAIRFDRQSRSLLITDFSQPPTVQRIAGDDGSLLQSYVMPDRLAGCTASGMDVTGDGNMWLLLTCWDYDHATTRVHVINRAGKLQREFPVPTGVFTSASEIVLDPFADRLFILFNVHELRSPAYDFVQVHTLDGAPLFNLSLNATSPPVRDVRDVILVGDAVMLLERDRNRLTLFNTRTGALTESYPTSDSVHITAIVASFDSYFLAQYSGDIDGPQAAYNSSVLRISYDGTVLEEFRMGPRLDGALFEILVINDQGDRLYGFDSRYSTIAVWRVGRRGLEGEQAMQKRLEQPAATKPDVAPVITTFAEEVVQPVQHALRGQRRGLRRGFQFTQ